MSQRLNTPDMTTEDEETKRCIHQFDITQTALMGGHLFHPSIPTELIKNAAIANLKDYTGIWMKKVVQQISGYSSGTTSNQPSLLVAFSGPHDTIHRRTKDGFQIVSCDFAKSFEDRWHGKFDVVNIRLPLVVKGEQEYSNLARRAFELLSITPLRYYSSTGPNRRSIEPGGYLQWLDHELLETTSEPDYSTLAKLKASVSDFRHRDGYSMHVGTSIRNAITNVRYRTTNDASGREHNMFQIIDDSNLVSGTQAHVEDVGEKTSLEMRKSVLFDLLYFNQLSCLVDGNRLHMDAIRGTSSPELTAELRARMDTCSDLDTEAGQLLKKSLDELRIQGVFPFIVARKVDELALSIG